MRQRQRRFIGIVVPDRTGAHPGFYSSLSSAVPAGTKKQGAYRAPLFLWPNSVVVRGSWYVVRGSWLTPSAKPAFFFLPPCSNASGCSDGRITMLPGILDRHAPIGGSLQARRPVGCGRVQQGAGLWIAGQGGIRGCFEAQQAHLHGILPDAFDQPDLPDIEGIADVRR